MSDILQYRKQFYESSYDVRVTCAKGDSAEEIANKVLEKLKESRHQGFTSTREKYPDARETSPRFLDVVLQGLAPDGGLYVPKRKIPHFTQGNINTVYCRKIPILSREFIFVQKTFLLGLFSGELIFGGTCYWKEFCVSK